MKNKTWICTSCNKTLECDKKESDAKHDDHIKYKDELICCCCNHTSSHYDNTYKCDKCGVWAKSTNRKPKGEWTFKCGGCLKIK
jgi:hypothetical protein